MYLNCMDSGIANHHEDIAACCKRNKVKAFYLLGSAARNEATATSDVNFNVELDVSIPLVDYANHYFNLLQGLEDLLRKPVDRMPARSIKNPILEAEIEKSKTMLSAA